LVYSTDPDFKIEEEIDAVETMAPGLQKLVITLDTKNRAGKAVTLVKGFVGTPDAIELLGKQLKAYCGTGGSAKEGEIIIQGDNRDKVLQWLLKNGYSAAKKR
jgi:translation initiation factor 1